MIGKFARTPRYQGGGSSHINAFRVESLMDALEGVEGITYAQGYDVKSEEPDESLIAQAENAAFARKTPAVSALDDHVVHIEEHTRYYLSEYETMSEREYRAVEAHVAEHKRRSGADSGQARG